MKKFLLVVSLITIIVSLSSFVAAETVLSGCGPHALNIEGENYVLEGDITDCALDSVSVSVFTLAANDVTLDCKGHQISGLFQEGDPVRRATYASGSYFGFQIQNCEFRSFHTPIYAQGLEDLTLRDNYLADNNFALHLSSVGSVTLSSNTIVDNLGSGILVPTSGTGSLSFVENNVLCSNSLLIPVEDNPMDFSCLESPAAVTGTNNYVGAASAACGWPTETNFDCSAVPEELLLAPSDSLTSEEAVCVDEDLNGIYENCFEELQCAAVANSFWFEGLCYSPAYIDFTGDLAFNFDDTLAFVRALELAYTGNEVSDQFDLTGDNLINWRDIKRFVIFRAAFD